MGKMGLDTRDTHSIFHIKFEIEEKYTKYLTWWIKICVRASGAVNNVLNKKSTKSSGTLIYQTKSKNR